MIKVYDIAFPRFRAPDLDKAEKFLLDFGLVRSARTDNVLYMRGSGPDRYCHVTELGEPAFVGFAFRAAEAKDLETISRSDGASSVEQISGPGGGKRVRLKDDPNGYQVEVVHGIENVDPLPVKNKSRTNVAPDYARKGELLRLTPGPAQVKRLGHGVLFVEKFEETVDYYVSNFGLLTSDILYEGDEKNPLTVAQFLRCDRGQEYTEHHTLFLSKWDSTFFHHVGYEVEDYNAIILGHEHLKEKNYEAYWGIARHVQGAQIFDSWRNEWGHAHEHWTDSDLLNADSPSGREHVSKATHIQWGTPAPKHLI